MKILVWTIAPSPKRLLRAIRLAAAQWLIDAENNRKACVEAKQFLLRLKDFAESAFTETAVNLVHGMPWKIAAFKWRLKVDRKAAASSGQAFDIYDYLLRALGTQVDICNLPHSAIAALSSNAPLLIVSNHPYPPFDGLSVMSAVKRYRPDFSILVNSNNCLLKVFPQFDSNVIPLQMEGGLLGSDDKNEIRRSQLFAIRKAIGDLNSGGCVILFPAGQGSKATRWGDPIADLPWMPGLGSIVEHFANRGKDLTILPVHIGGHMGTPANSRRYQWAVIERPSWLPAMLQMALFNPPEKIKVSFGDPIVVASFVNSSASNISSKLRQEVYKFASETVHAERMHRK